MDSSDTEDQGNAGTRSSKNRFKKYKPPEVSFRRHRTNLWPCVSCNQDFPRYRDLYNHMEAGVHVNVEPPEEYKQKYGGQSAEKYKSFQGDDEFEFDDDGDGGNDGDTEDRKTIHNQACTTLALSCYLCKEEVANFTKLDQHLLAQHRTLKCRCFVENCLQSYTDKESLNSHLNSHQGEVFLCPHCPTHKPFKSHESLRRHLYRDHWEGRFRCSYEGCSFPESATRAPIMNHFNRVHRVKKLQVPGVMRTMPKTPKTPKTKTETSPGTGTPVGKTPQMTTISLNCYICKGKVADFKELDGHLLGCHGLAKCQCYLVGCGKSFEDWDALTEHLKLHPLDSFRCPHCPAHKPFSNNGALKNHLYRDHWEGQFRCGDPSCDFPETTTRAPITMHYNRVHKNKKHTTVMYYGAQPKEETKTPQKFLASIPTSTATFQKSPKPEVASNSASTGSSQENLWGDPELDQMLEDIDV